MENNSQQSTSKTDSLSACTPEDFDGHTDFQKMTAEERLRWLSQMAQFVYEVSKNNPKLGSGRFFKNGEIKKP